MNESISCADIRKIFPDSYIPIHAVNIKGTDISRRFTTLIVPLFLIPWKLNRYGKTVIAKFLIIQILVIETCLVSVVSTLYLLSTVTTHIGVVLLRIILHNLIQSN